MHPKTFTFLAVFLFGSLASAQSDAYIPTPSQTSAESSPFFSPTDYISYNTTPNSVGPTSSFSCLTLSAYGSTVTCSQLSDSTTTTTTPMSGSPSTATPATATTSQPSSAGVNAQATAAVMAVGAGIIGVIGVAAIL